MGEPAFKIKPWWERTAANDPVIADRHPGTGAAIDPASYTPNVVSDAWHCKRGFAWFPRNRLTQYTLYVYPRVQ